ncbi:hypothetical protein Lacidipiscis_00060 [Ligilactobacillus acidipiscis]|nr:hypothetical protein Lacidipiscis_00060 [Ligilactobacillus acidipiscis]
MASDKAKTITGTELVIDHNSLLFKNMSLEKIPCKCKGVSFLLSLQSYFLVFKSADQYIKTGGFLNIIFINLDYIRVVEIFYL